MRGGAFFNGKKGRDDFRNTALQGGYILSSLREERLGENGGAFLKGKEGRVGFRTHTTLSSYSRGTTYYR